MDAETIIRNTCIIAWKALGWSIAAPFRLGIVLGRLWATRCIAGDTVPCSTCGAEINQLGLWECASCSFSFYGSYFAPCPLCTSTPLFIACGQCGAATKNYLL